MTEPATTVVLHRASARLHRFADAHEHERTSPAADCLDALPPVLGRPLASWLQEAARQTEPSPHALAIACHLNLAHRAVQVPRPTAAEAHQ